MVACPICGKSVKELNINSHIDSGCESHVESQSPQALSSPLSVTPHKSTTVSSFFQTPAARKTSSTTVVPQVTAKRPLDVAPATNGPNGTADESISTATPSKRQKPSNAFPQTAPLAERMRPRTLDEVCGQDLVGPSGVLRGLIEQGRVPSMILWGDPGTGKTTIARLVANTAGSRFIEINSTSAGVADCKKIFAEAKGELSLSGRKTIIFCDEIHRFSKTQQDVFLGPVESGQVVLIGATTENPSFKIQNALLSRCRTFTLQKLSKGDLISILGRALVSEHVQHPLPPLVDDELISYLATFADGDARTALNLLELALGLATRGGMTKDNIKKALTKTLVYDRAGDQHYDTISGTSSPPLETPSHPNSNPPPSDLPAFHKSVRGSDPDASLYYLARMLQSGEDPLYIARRLIVIASEDVGLADNTLLPLATAAHSAVEKIGLPEARINLAHATAALALAPKSTRAYRALANAMSACEEPGVAGLPVPPHLRNAPTRLMKELGYGKEYKYPPDYRDGRVVQEGSRVHVKYLPDELRHRKFLEDLDLGTKVDPDIVG
ncbi:hypothetical protein FGG08_005762 [Glutinoglossum americanum]|uniref:UBZ4-type domain-containing protein n=1 Tax=Glutinoglossum americanum TaxID=1670608 RepID=A0A9P8I8T2_9PEZI|nr:hypothetical protein FGG08_005762 [Glutinoglossum americanum]